ncbi:MAG: hypothetical protein KKA32_00655 [Actinobacteria bacterium]|nr:hypothetical protein [Actinomycetota bacterium]
MWVIVHTVSGLALGAALGHEDVGAPWWIVAIVALIAHALLDVVPHWDYTRQPRLHLWVLGDVGASLIVFVTGWLVFDLPGLALLGAAISAAPDLDVLDAVLPVRRHRRLFPSHWKAYPHGSMGPLGGMLVQAAVVGLSLLAVVRLTG